MKVFYLDHAATTPLHQSVLDEMMPYMTTHYGNPSSMHHMGIDVKRKMNESREVVAKIFHVDAKGVIFTSGGTEATNLAIFGYAKLHPNKKEIITSVIEHHATLHTIEALEKEGYRIHRIAVDKEGFIDIDDFKRALSKETLMVSLIWANNEIGTIQDMKLIGELAHQVGAMVHVDAVQMVPHFKIDLREYPVDLMTISAHKFYGPKGIGALIMKNHLALSPILHGGNQEFGLRSGTENVYGVVGLAAALKRQMDVLEERKDEKNRVDVLRDLIQSLIPNVRFNGPKDMSKRLPGLLSFSLPNLSSQDLAFMLDELGVYVSTGSACLSNEILTSHVLKAIGVDESFGTIRLSLGYDLSKDELIEISNRIDKAYQRLISL